MVRCEVYQKNRHQEWNAFIEQSRTPLFFFKREFLEYHSTQLNDFSLMFYAEDKLIAIIPANLLDDETLVSHGGVTYGGMIFLYKTRSDEVQIIMKKLIEFLKQNQLKTLRYKEIPYIFYEYPSQEDLYFIYRDCQANIIKRDLSSCIYLENRIKPSKGRRWLVNKAIKMQLEVSKSIDFEGFYALLVTVLAKHAAKPVHTLEEIVRLYELFPENIELRVVKLNQRILAATLLFKFNSVIHTQYMATCEEGKEFGALDYLIEECISYAYQAGYKYFNFGISTEQNGLILNQGLIAQKENFGARGIKIDTYEVKIS